MSPTLAKSSESLQSARQKRTVEDAVAVMDAGCAAMTVDMQGGDEEMSEDSATKRPKTGDSTGVTYHCLLTEFY